MDSGPYPLIFVLLSHASDPWRSRSAVENPVLSSTRTLLIHFSENAREPIARSHSEFICYFERASSENNTNYYFQLESMVVSLRVQRLVHSKPIKRGLSEIRL